MSDKNKMQELGGVAVTEDWMNLFETRPYDALLSLPDDAFTVDFVHAIIQNPSFYTAGYSHKLNKWCSIPYTISMIPKDIINSLSDDDIVLMCGGSDMYTGSFDCIKNYTIRARITTDMMMRIFVKSLTRRQCSKLSVQHFPRPLVTQDFIQAALPEYSYILLSILPKDMKTLEVYKDAMRFNPACYGRIPAEMRTTQRAQSCLDRACDRDDITDSMLRGMLKAVPNINAIDINVLEKLVQKHPSLLKTLISMSDKLNIDKLLRAACQNKDDKELRKAIAATPVDVLRLYLTAGFHTLQGVGNLS